MTRVPLEVYPLAQLIAEEMQERDWTAVDVAKRMVGDYGMNIGIVNLVLCVHRDDMRLDDCIDNLALAFDVSAEMFRSLHQKWLDNPNARQPFECPEHLLDGLVFPAHN